MIYVFVVYRGLFGGLVRITKEFKDRNKALRYLYAMKASDKFVIDGYSCDDPYDNEWLGRRFK